MPSARHARRPGGGKVTAEFCDARIAVLAERQHGVVSRRQLVEAGVSRDAIDGRLARGVLRVVHRGVFAVGHPALTAEGRWIAATLATGGVLSHRAAAALHLLRASSYLEVTAPTRRTRKGIHIHGARLRPDEITTKRGIPVTTVPRTLFDLATVVRESEVARAVNEAEIQRRSDPLSLPDLLNRYPGRAGTATINTVLANLQSGAGITREGLEDRFAAFITEHRLPPPEFNAWLPIRGTWIECDCVWRPQCLIAELDGRATHGTRAAFESDRARDRALQAAGWRTIRLTWQQLQYDAQMLAVDLRALLTGPSL